jgi:hypothetical protein
MSNTGVPTIHHDKMAVNDIISPVYSDKIPCEGENTAADIYGCHSNQSLFTQLSLHSHTVTLIFTIFSCFSSEIHYRTKAVVCQNSRQMHNKYL